MADKTTKSSNNSNKELFENAKGDLDKILHLACKLGNVEKIHEAVDDGADVNSLDEFNRTPIMNAILFENYNCAINLIDMFQVNLSIEDLNGTTVLGHLSKQRVPKSKHEISNLIFIKLLEERIRQLNWNKEKEIFHNLVAIEDKDKILLFIKCMKEIEEKIPDLLTEDDKNFINKFDHNRNTPLMLCVFTENKSIATCLIENGANLYAKQVYTGNTVFHIALLHQKLKFFKILLGCRAYNDLKNFVDQSGEKTEDVFIKFISRELPKNHNNETILHTMFNNFHGLKIKKLKKVVKDTSGLKCVDLNAKENVHENTILHIAAKSCPYVYDMLVECGADKTIKNKYGKTPEDLFNSRDKFATYAQ